MALNKVSSSMDEGNMEMKSSASCQGAKPKVFTKSDTTSMGAQGDRNMQDSLQKWKEAGIALRKALATVDKASSDRKPQAGEDAGDSAASKIDSRQLDSLFSGNDMNSLVEQEKEKGIELAEDKSYRQHRQPLYKRTSNSMHRIHPDSQMCSDKRDAVRTEGTEGCLGLSDLHKDSIDSCLKSSSTCRRRGSSHGVCPAKHRHCHKSRLPVPVRRASVRDKNTVAEATTMEKRPTTSNSTKSRSVVHRRKSKSLQPPETKIPVPCDTTSLSSSSEDEFGPPDKPSSVAAVHPTASAANALTDSSHLMTADSMANLADEELSSASEQSIGELSDAEKKVLFEASLALGDKRPENPLSILSSSEESLASVLSSGEEVLVAAENLLATPPPQDSIEGKADEQYDDSLDLESEDNLSFGDFNASDESQAHEEDQPDNDIDQALFDLKVQTSDEMEEEEEEGGGGEQDGGGEVTCEDADDEYECECATCQYYDGLPDLMPRMGPGFGSDASSDSNDDDNFFGDLDIGYRFRPQDLSMSMGTLLFEEGRVRFLELMFHNVILQMLTVYPDLLGDQAPPPLSPQQLEALPSISISQEKADEECPCPICLCVFTVEEEAKELPCHHVFHTLCIQAWLAKSGTCPVCRHKLASEGD